MGLPAASAAVLAEIRKLTDKPVKYVVNSHWHWDHWYGTEVYQQAFPGLRVVAQEKTRELMMGPALEFNRPGIERDLPGYIAGLERSAPNSNELAEARFFLDQKKNVHHVFPNVTYTSQMTVFLGEREIRILHYGRAVTPSGDTLLYLPREKIVITGDLLGESNLICIGLLSDGMAAHPRTNRRARCHDNRAGARRGHA